MDVVSAEKRSEMMRAVHGKDTSPESILGKMLHSSGFRYRKNVVGLPGSPDLVLKKHSAAIFVNGCFWHRHSCKKATSPKSNVEFWEKKFEANVFRDKRDVERLRSMGWRVAVVWECSLSKKRVVATVSALSAWLGEGGSEWFSSDEVLHES